MRKSVKIYKWQNRKQQIRDCETLLIIHYHVSDVNWDHSRVSGILLIAHLILLKTEASFLSTGMKMKFLSSSVIMRQLMGIISGRKERHQSGMASLFFFHIYQIFHA